MTYLYKDDVDKVMGMIAVVLKEARPHRTFKPQLGKIREFLDARTYQPCSMFTDDHIRAALDAVRVECRWLGSETLIDYCARFGSANCLLMMNKRFRRGKNKRDWPLSYLVIWLDDVLKRIGKNRLDFPSKLPLLYPPPRIPTPGVVQRVLGVDENGVPVPAKAKKAKKR